MCPLRHQTTDGINAICCRTKHNRAKPMSELPSAIFLIADGNEFRFARFYIVCEEVPLGTPESPPIVSGVPDMHPSDCPNVEETRNPMQTFSRKKCSHFSPTNFHLHFHMKSPSVFPVILLIKPKHGMLRATPPFIFISIRCFSAMRYTPSPSNAGMKLSSAVSPS